jgi:hypothetical protein
VNKHEGILNFIYLNMPIDLNLIFLMFYVTYEMNRIEV